MGIYMSATAIIGVKFTPTETSVETKKRGCSHPDSEENFCSECGSSIWIKDISYSPQFEDIHEDFIEPVLDRLNDLFDGCAIIESDYNTCDFYIGYGVTSNDFGKKRIAAMNPELVVDDLKQVLREFEVWEQCEDSFGLWIISTVHH